jgi:ribonuclease-3
MDNDYNQVFQSRVILGDTPVGIGIGYSKKESQQNAAKMTIKKLRSERGLMQGIKSRQKAKEEKERFESYLKIDPESYFLNGLKSK